MALEGIFLYDEDPRAVDKSKYFHGPLGMAVAGTQKHFSSADTSIVQDRALQGSPADRQLTLKQ